MMNKKENLLDDFDEEIENDGSVNKGKRVLFIIIPVAIILVSLIIYGILRFTKSEVSAQNQEKSSSASAGEYIFIEIDDIIVSLSSSSSKKNFLKTSLSLQVKSKSDSEIVNAKLPIIKDSFQMFLRELRPSDLSGSAGVLMLKNELLKRINKIVAPIEVTDVLFKEILLS